MEDGGGAGRGRRRGGGMGQKERGWLWGRGVTCLSYFGDDSAAAAAYKQREVEAGLKSVASGSSRATRLLPCGEAPALQRGSLCSVLTLRRSSCPYLAPRPCLACRLTRLPWHRAGQGQGSLWGLLGPSLTGRGDRQIRERSPECSPPQPGQSSGPEAGREPLCPQRPHLHSGHSPRPAPLPLPRMKARSVSSFSSLLTSSWKWLKEAVAAGRKLCSESVALRILGRRTTGTSGWDRAAALGTRGP